MGQLDWEQGHFPPPPICHLVVSESSRRQLQSCFTAEKAPHEEWMPSPGTKPSLGYEM